MLRLHVTLRIVSVSLCAAASLAIAQRPDSTPPRTVRLAAPVDVDMINVGTDAQPLPAVEVMLNGRGPFRFGIETGARFLVVSSDVAMRAGLAKLSDEDGISIYRADSINIGNAMLGDVKLVTLDRAPRGVDGLLGLPAFAALTLTLDYPHHRVRFERDTLPSPDNQSVVATTRASDFVALPIRYGEHQIATVVDTRSTTEFGIEPATAERFRWKSSPVAAGSATGAAIPTTSIRRGIFGDTVHIGRYELLSTPITVHALPPDFPHDPRIGAGVLKNFVFSLDQRTSRARLLRDDPIIDFAVPVPASTPSIGITVNDYIGTFGDRTISVRDGKLYLTRAGGQALEMRATGRDQFGLVVAPTAKIQFTRDMSGNVIEMAVLSSEGNWVRARRSP